MRRALIAGGLVLLMPAVPAVRVDAASLCNQAAQQASICLGFVEMPGLERHEAALAGALLRGDDAKARRFVAAVEDEVAAGVRRRMGEALRRERLAVGAGSDYLVGRVASLPMSRAPVEQTAAQDFRGNCCATDRWRWELSPKEWPYGRCSPGEGCPATGSLRIDMRTNIFDFPTIVYDHFFEEASGPKVHIDSMAVRMKRDRGGGPDPTIADYDCPPGNLPLGCGTDTRESGTGIDDYYYISTRFDGTPRGEPSWSFEFQTRRWKVDRGGDAEFPAAQAGG